MRAMLVAIPLAIALAIMMVACTAAPAGTPQQPAGTPQQPAGTPQQPAATDPHAEHSDRVADAIKAELSERFGMTFASAGPHHTLGKAPDGVQIDLVGVPVEQVVLSIPGDDAATVRDNAQPYLPYLARLLGLGTNQAIGRDLLLESLTSWDGRAGLDKRREANGIEARLTSTTTPPYVVLSVAR